VDFGGNEGPAAESWPAVGMPTPVGELEELPPPRRRRSRLWIAGAVLVVVIPAATVLTLTGSSTKSAVVVLSEAAARTTSSGTARASTIETLTLDGVTSTPIDVEASEDFGKKSSTATMFDSHGNTIEKVRTVAGVVYLSIPKSGPLPGGAHWLSLTPADVNLDPAAMSGIGSQDPSSGLRFLSAVDGSPRVVDHDPLAGVKVTHYAFTLNVEPLLDRIGKGSDKLGMPAFGQALEQVRSLVDLTKLPGEAWIDADGRVRRFAMTIALVEEGHTGKVVVDVRFSHFNEAVAVAAPAASDTVPFRQVPHFFSDLGKTATHA